MSPMTTEIQPFPRLTPIETAAMRLRGKKNRTSRDEYYTDVNLFSVMYDAGAEWAEYHVGKHYGDKALYSEQKITKAAHKIAVAMTRAIQAEYDISLKDWQIGHMYGMSHDHALHALGYQIPIPTLRAKRSGRFREQVAGLRRTKRYIKSQENQEQVTETGE